MILTSLNLQADFDDFFKHKTLRVDYFHAGDANSEHYFLDQVKIEPFWGGSLVNLIDTFQYGHYYLKVFNASNDSLLYSRGYSSLFAEWQTTEEASRLHKSFSETVVCPLPRYPAYIMLYSRDSLGHFKDKFRYDFDPENYFISTERNFEFPAFESLISGPSEHCVDIVILPDGYTNSDMGKFINDCKKFAEDLFTFKPYDIYRDKFNIRGVWAPSDDAGSDIPADSVWKRTILNTSFYTFDSERYCMTYDNKNVRDLAANVPYDQIYILVNTDKYGGGAIYNYYSVSVNSNLHAAKIFVHEFGHGFAGLGDEYYDSSVAYSEFYPTNIEPWEPNLTTMVDFDRKWKNLLDDKTPVPTPPQRKYFDKTGVFEGGGYAAKGVYRPAYDCLMNSFSGDHFCAVCQKAIEHMILFYAQ
ncbi:MAG: peptidase M64 [Bacteroidales bacterium]|nr:peptidase M64 [Bacteroidales bacterium]